MKLEYYSPINDICAEYTNDLVERSKNPESLSPELRKLLDLFMKTADIDTASPDESFDDVLTQYSHDHGITSIDHLFDGELSELALFILGEEFADLFVRYVRLLAQIPYTRGYYRRSFRCVDADCHIYRIYGILKDFLICRATGFTTAELLRGGRNPEEIKELRRGNRLSCEEWLTAKINAGDTEVINYLVEAMTSENNANRMEYAHFRAIAKSGNRELLELEGKLLLAARLQEGLRQAIVETMDDGKPESFIYLLKVIIDNDLMRFASVKRGLAVSTGLGEEDAAERITAKMFSLVHQYLSDHQAAIAAVDSKDAMEIYLALWAIAFHDSKEAAPYITRLIEEGPAYRSEAALLLLSNMQEQKMMHDLSATAIRINKDNHAVVAGAIDLYFPYNAFNISRYSVYGKESIPQLQDYYRDKEEAEADFRVFEEIFASMKGNETFSPYVFPWMEQALSKDKVAMIICRIALILNTDEYLDKALDYVGALDAAFHRGAYFKFLLRNPNTRKQIDAVVAGMCDKSTDTRDEACTIAKRLHNEGKLAEGDYLTMESFLRLKAATMRTAIIGMLGSRPDVDAIGSVRRLLAEKSADKRMAGLDIVKSWIDNGTHPALIEECRTLVAAIAKPTAKEQVLIDVILSEGDSSDTYSEKNGYGLYDPAGVTEFNVTAPEGFSIEKALAYEDPEEPVRLMRGIMDLIGENADYEFKNAYGETVRLGNCVQINTAWESGLERLALPEIWKEFYEKEIGSPLALFRLRFAIANINPLDQPLTDVLIPLFGKAIRPDWDNEIKENEYYRLAIDVVLALFNEYGRCDEVNEAMTDIISTVAANVSAEDSVKNYNNNNYRWGSEEDHIIYAVSPFSFIADRNYKESSRMSDTLFMRSFTARANLFGKTSGCTSNERSWRKIVSPYQYLRAWKLGMLSDEDIWRTMMGKDFFAEEMVSDLTASLPCAWQKRIIATELPVLDAEESNLVNTVVDRILDIELKRGDTPTPVTHLAEKINGIAGADYFTTIIAGLGKDSLASGYWSEPSRRNIFSRLLQNCVPLDTDTPSDLMKKVKERGIATERLVEAAIYSPAWLEIVEEATGWKGLTGAAYYFTAHAADRLSERSKSFISRYTPVDPADFADGACDPDWFREVYKSLGKKRYEVVYNAAKYVADGNRHTRARKLADAILGNLKVKPAMKEITAQRNKDLVVALGLIPLGRNKLNDIRQRYSFLNKFLKESKQFGAQRQASESRAVKLALDNLARTAGYGDSTRLTWSMEADLVREFRRFLSPAEVDSVSIWIEIGEGMPEIMIESNSKPLQSIPARLNKEKYVTELKEVYKRLKEQHVRGRALLEQAMVESAEFSGEEIAALRDNPVIWHMLSRLVLVTSDGTFGFPHEDGKSLVTADGELVDIAPQARLRIAHPYDLWSADNWSGFQQSLFDRQWRQPVKQGFRELYVATSEEKEQSDSRRYSGNQIMPMRAAGVLKKRQWTVDYDNGLHKVCYHGDVTAVLYALADWFSPADIEAPTVEYVSFHDRRTFKRKKISDVLPVVFSEIMRDVDLAVSVAHAGGVDPETSHSTIEMRRAIVEHAIPMFGVENVTVSGNFAKVAGTLASYNIHLGSGVIHKEGGAQIAVLPVHSQSRGRIFLPFLDEDPKTAEIISKILLFAEDSKIKDPMILDQI